MYCQECNWENEAKQTFCNNCGTRLDLDFQDVEENFSNEIQFEREEETTSQVLQYFVFSLYVLFFLLVFRSCVSSNPPAPQVLPSLESPIDGLPAKEGKPIKPYYPLEIPQGE